MTLADVSGDLAYRALAEQVVRAACDANDIEVGEIEFGAVDGDRSWLCFVVDPHADDRVVALTGSSAADHLALENPNGILLKAGSRIDVSVSAVELSDEASVEVRGDDGTRRLISPWQQDLAVVRVRFSYR